VRAVSADPARKLYENQQFMNAHFETTALPGPVGHGFTQRNLDTGETWWSADVSPFVRIFGLDTCNQIAGPDGAVPEDQFEWLKAELAKLADERKLGIVISHHNSFTLENGAVPALGPSQRLIHAEEFVAMLNQFPHMVAWLNGHTHINTITAHPRDGGGGFWEITTASCVDFPQQQQVVEIVDNRDGTLSLFTTVLDHASPAVYRDGDFSPTALASLSRQLSANDWSLDPTMRMGSPLDRNCELLVPAPFDLSVITDAEVEKAQAEARARLLAYEQARPA
jgi:metallophosphoesterase (TIGR03767 family)